nr:beta 13 n galactosyltransferase [Hymenolepis microstoma]
MIRYLRVPSQICPPLENEYAEKAKTNPSHHDVVIIYKSGVYKFESRNQIRQFCHLDRYDLKIDLVFSIGMPTTMESNIFQRDGFNVTLNGRAGEKMLEHIRSPQRTFERLRQEMEEHDDLLIGDYEDTYFNLTLKLFHSYHWAARFCRLYTPTFIFMDDDYAVNPKKLVAYLKSRAPEELEKLNHGFDRPENVVFRLSHPIFPQWTFLKKEIPWPMNMPEYLGIYNVFGYSVVEDIAIGMYFTKPIVFDGTYIAIIMDKLNLPLLRLDRMTFGDMLPKRRHTCAKILFVSLDDIEARKCFF